VHGDPSLITNKIGSLKIKNVGIAHLVRALDSYPPEVHGGSSLITNTIFFIYLENK